MCEFKFYCVFYKGNFYFLIIKEGYNSILLERIMLKYLYLCLNVILVLIYNIFSLRNKILC